MIRTIEFRFRKVSKVESTRKTESVSNDLANRSEQPEVFCCREIRPGFHRFDEEPHVLGKRIASRDARAKHVDGSDVDFDQSGDRPK